MFYRHTGNRDAREPHAPSTRRTSYDIGFVRKRTPSPAGAAHRTMTFEERQPGLKRIQRMRVPAAFSLAVPRGYCVKRDQSSEFKLLYYPAAGILEGAFA